MSQVLAVLLLIAGWGLAISAWAEEGPPSTPPPSTVPEAPSAPKPKPQATPAQPDDQDIVLRGIVTTRGPDDPRVGIGLSGEMRSPLPWELEGGPGFELDFWQGQDSGNVFSYLPVYWVLEYHPVDRYPKAFLSGRFGFDTFGQEGDDTLASRMYYALGIGLNTHLDGPKILQWEILYSRMRGAFPGIGLSVGYRF
ncbi:MAG: hypothetical protein AB1451_01305 [Nitrospirota bacterium]